MKAAGKDLQQGEMGEMANQQRSDGTKRADHLAAQLGLAAADTPEAAGMCLTAEQLADVATGHCTPEERKEALAHFSSCRSCYDAWVSVSLSLVAMESGLERRRRPLLSLRNLGFLGSAVAVAASVVVFFNLQGDLDRVAPPARKAVQAPAPPGQQAESIEHSSAPVKPVPKETQEMRKKRLESVPGKSVSVPSGRLAEQLSDRKEADGDMEAEAPPDKVVIWLNALSAYCRQEDEPRSPERWLQLQAEGQALAAIAGEGGVEIEKMVEEMGDTALPTQIAVRCETILSHLAGVVEKE